MRFSQVIGGSGFEWKKRKSRKTKGEVQQVIEKVQAEYCGGLDQGVLTRQKEMSISGKYAGQRNSKCGDWLKDTRAVGLHLYPCA